MIADLEPEAATSGRTGPRFEALRLWNQRRIIVMLVRRDWMVRYRQTVVGAAWALLQPIILIGIFALFLGRVVPLGATQISYPLFAFSGIIPWMLLTSGVTAGSNAYIANADLLKKTPIPGAALPAASCLGYLADYSIGSLVVLIFAALAGVSTPLVYSLPVILWAGIAVSMMAIGLSMIMAPINARFRDIKHATPFLLQAWFFATPVLYPIDLLPEQVGRLIVYLNPMVAPVTIYRGALTGFETSISWETMLITSLVAVSLMGIGCLFILNWHDRVIDTL